ncbi:MAG: FepA family TonB-dependent siderophore receptor [Alphaproteobacteria bacterium]|nr:FepA family TonB-dependent siderophore receptor [Alphaproteobacteria bacterium]MBU1552239.1 FepA family TonB-dependent siderophore receptor [Alphaproteobacteria bacterium]MBU2336853.1 FepA family TonB-dependent siderophore receptor [Alphaproteobacteria bacterium]MBU2389609.1 FepA family TonB-dependent siderophore receptor [Alphaproteobacteria bacterium]
MVSRRQASDHGRADQARLLLTTALGAVLAVQAWGASAQERPAEDDTILETIVISAEEQLKQAPGVSTITAEDLSKAPPANDLAEIIRKMPGVNLTGTTASGQRGNQRQIDLRGMGPENTLILIDGKPVLSRNSVRMGRAGERDSRGDTNWVPAEAVERIEVIRGPAAARYGSGAAGGVVNIITKRPETLSGSVSTYLNVPQHGEEGMTRRGSILLGGPIGDTMSFRLLGSYNKTDADDADINAEANVDPTVAPPAGREGVVNKDVRALLSIEPTADHIFDIEGALSRQGNIFTGDRQLTSTNPTLESVIGEETNVMRRGTLSVTHRGTYDFGDSLSYIQWERTLNERLLEGLAGGPEGSITSTEWGETRLDNLTAKSEWNLPLDLGGFDQTLTLGTEFRGEWLEDNVSNQQAVNGSVTIPGTTTDPDDRDPTSSSMMWGVFLEDNIEVTDRLTLTPGLRYDYHDAFGSNWSPSLNASYDITEEVSVKAGIARAFKAPNLYQLNPDYVYYTRGNGCPVDYPNRGGGCYVVGNPDLEAEVSINKEIGINYHNDTGWNAGVTYFHNDYKNRISSGLVPEGTSGTAQYFQWYNVPEAVVSGLEGNLNIPLNDALTWTSNFTYMLESEDKRNGQPLSLVPDYTINTALDWQVRDELVLTLSATHYGETASPTMTATTGATVTNPEPRDPYTLVNVGFKYDVNETYRLSGGVNNVFDKRVLREGSGNAAGANTYNEPGRSFYVSLTATF